MRRYLLLLAITLSSNFVKGQKGIDTICISTPQLKKVYAAALQKRVADSLLLICEKQVSELKEQIKLLNEKDIELKIMYDGQLDNLRNQIDLYKDQITGYEKLVKRERFRRRLTTFGGIFTTGVMAYLFIIKK